MCVCVRERESVCERERESVCVREREGVRDSACVCVREREREIVRERERERESVCVCEREREGVCACVCVCVLGGWYSNVIVYLLCCCDSVYVCLLNYNLVACGAFCSGVWVLGNLRTCTYTYLHLLMCHITRLW